MTRGRCARRIAIDLCGLGAAGDSDRVAALRLVAGLLSPAERLRVLLLVERDGLEATDPLLGLGAERHTVVRSGFRLPPPHPGHVWSPRPASLAGVLGVDALLAPLGDSCFVEPDVPTVRPRGGVRESVGSCRALLDDAVASSAPRPAAGLEAAGASLARSSGSGPRYPTISVLIPSYQQGRFIERTLRSVLDQDLPEIEVFVCDGGSTDETLDVLRQYDSRIRWVSEPDRGQSHAVNKALAATSGEIVAWLNSDDLYGAGALALVSRVFGENPSIMACYGAAEHIDDDDRFLGYYPTRAWDEAALRDSCYLAQPATFFRRELVDRFGGLDESLDYCMDYDLWFRYGERAGFLYVPVVLAACRMHSSSKTVSRRLPHHIEINDMLRARFPAVPDGWLLAFAAVWAEERGNADRVSGNRFSCALLRAAAYGCARWDTPLSSDLRARLLAHRDYSAPAVT